MLTPAERAAVARSQGSGDEFDQAQDEGAAPAGNAAEKESKLDKAGKVGLSVLTVGITLGAAAAPFLLF